MLMLIEAYQGRWYWYEALQQVEFVPANCSPGSPKGTTWNLTTNENNRKAAMRKITRLLASKYKEEE